MTHRVGKLQRAVRRCFAASKWGAGADRGLPSAREAAGAGLAAARKRGVKLGSRNARSDQTRAGVQACAEALRPVFAELADLTTQAAADALNERGIKTAAGGRWHAMQVHGVR